MEKEKTLKTLGLAYRARKVLLGYDTFVEELKNKKIYCVFSSFLGEEDAYRKLKNKCEFYNIPLIEGFSPDDFYHIIGKKNIKMLFLIDEGFYKLINNN